MRINSINKTPLSPVFLVILCYKNFWILGLFRWLASEGEPRESIARSHLES